MEGTGTMEGPWDSEHGSERERRDRDVASLALAFLFGAGGTLGLVSLLLPHPASLDANGITVVALAAYPVAGLCALLRPFPWGALEVTLALGTVMITIAVELSGTFAGAYTFFYLWVALFAAYFFSRKATFLHVGFAGACYGAAIIAGGARDEWAFGWLLAVGTLAVTAVLVRALKERVERLVDQLSRAASTDDLSGLLNRRGFNERLAAELRRATRSEQSLALIVGDLDRFKEINDRFGHPAGDEALRRVGALLRQCARESDTVARLGGEEFGLVLPYTEPPGALAMAERIRKLIRADFAAEGLTISFGIAAYPDDGESQDMLMHAADDALYTAKTLGRDRIEVPRGG
jgi:diguanylate cyclase (GGDEF)-like protein